MIGITWLGYGRFLARFKEQAPIHLAQPKARTVNQHKSGAKQTSTFEGDNVALGIVLMISFCLIIPFADAMVKLLSGTVPVLTLLTVRYALQVLLTAPIMIWHKGGVSHLGQLSGATWRRLGWRTAMHVLGAMGMYFGLKSMPLADTIAIAFIFPLLMLWVGYLFLGEQVGPHRLIAAVLGFLGTLMVVQPNFVAVGFNVLWPFGVAVSFVIFNLVTRQMSRAIDPASIQAVSGTLALIILLIPIALLNGEGYEMFDLVMPTAQDWPLLVGIGFAGTYGHLLMTAALRYAPSATLAPMQYLEIPFATLLGWMIFSDLPNFLAGIGIVVTVSAGLYIIFREQKIQRRAKS